MPLTIHKRYFPVRGEQLELKRIYLEWREKSQLTFIEAAQLCLELANDELRLALRVERHGTTKKKADEA